MPGGLSNERPIGVVDITPELVTAALVWAESTRAIAFAHGPMVARGRPWWGYPQTLPVALRVLVRAVLPAVELATWSIQIPTPLYIVIILLNSLLVTGAYGSQ